jgi:hypothetical protein
VLLIHHVVEKRAETGATQLGCSVGDRLHHALEVMLGRHHVAHFIQNLTGSGFFREGLRDPPLFRHVVGDLGRTHNGPGGIAHWRNSQRDVEPVAGLVDPYGLEAIDAFPPADPRQDIDLFLLNLRRYEPGDRLADHFRCAVTEQELGPLVPRGDDAFERLANDAVFG